MKKLQALLEKSNASDFDRVRVRTADGLDLEGVLMPRIDAGDTGCLILKLGNGYNTGISADSIKKIDRLAGSERKGIASKGKPAERKTEQCGTAKERNLARVAMIATGGTIASVVEYATGGVIGQLAPEDIAKAAPGLSSRAGITFHSPFRIMSEDMTHKEWQKISEIAAKEMAKEDVRGIIVTHGTDTLHFTSAALSFMLNEFSKPIAFVGAQRSPDRGSFDGVLNLECASIYATSDIGEKAVVMHGTSSDDYCIASRGTTVRKMHSTRRDAFRPISEPALAKIWPDGKIERTNGKIRPLAHKPDAKAQLDFESRIAIVKAYQSARAELVDYYVGKGYRGIILEATAMGHVPTVCVDPADSWIAHVKSAVDSGVYVGVTGQCVYGEVNPYVYTNLRRLASTGAHYLDDMLTETAYVKLGWALARSKGTWETRKAMSENIAGEYSRRHQYFDSFML